VQEKGRWGTKSNLTKRKRDEKCGGLSTGPGKGVQSTGTLEQSERNSLERFTALDQKNREEREYPGKRGLSIKKSKKANKITGAQLKPCHNSQERRRVDGKNRTHRAPEKVDSILKELI